jgi:hypothetical protein
MIRAAHICVTFCRGGDIRGMRRGEHVTGLATQGYRVVFAAEGHAAHVAHRLAQVPKVHHPARCSPEYCLIVVKDLAAKSKLVQS